MDLMHETICQLESMVDHLTGEEIGMALEALNAHPAILDAICLYGIGKKNRPLMLLQVLCLPRDADTVCEEIFRHTHTLGIRVQNIERVTIPREISSATLNGKEVPAKAYSLDGIRYLRIEAEAVREEAAKQDVGAPAIRLLDREGNKQV